MTGMTLNQFKKVLATYDEIEFSYLDEMYNFQKESAEGTQIKISVWRGGNKPKCCYSVTIDEHENFIDDLINAKIFSDGKSIVDGESNINVEFFT